MYMFIYIYVCMFYVHKHITVNIYIYCAYYDKAMSNTTGRIAAKSAQGSSRPEFARKNSHKFQSTFEDLLKCGAKTKMASEMPGREGFWDLF